MRILSVLLGVLSPRVLLLTLVGVAQVLHSDRADAAGPPASVDVTVVNTSADPVPVVVQRTPAEPVFLEFALLSPEFADEADYLVPDGKKLRIEFVGVRFSGESISAGELHNSVALQIAFANGEGGTCNRPSDEGDCSIQLPVIPLNNTDVGANVSFQFPSTAAPVPVEIPSGARVRSRLVSSFGVPDGFVNISVSIAGQLVDTAP
jgi:hypothetical protein